MEFSIVEILIIVAILSLNFAVILWFRNRIALVASTMIANLIIILLCSTIISDHQNLQELIIGTIFYSITLLALISNANHIDQINSSKKIVVNLNSKISYGILIITVLAISSTIFLVGKNTKIISGVYTKDYGSISHQIPSPEIPKEKSENENIDSKNNQKLQNNVLFRRSTDAILIMVGAIAILLLSSKYLNRESNI